MQGAQVRSLVRELRSHIPPGQKNQNVKQKQYCNKFNKDFKNGPDIQIKIKNNAQSRDGKDSNLTGRQLTLPEQGSKVNTTCSDRNTPSQGVGCP